MHSYAFSVENFEYDTEKKSSNDKLHSKYLSKANQIVYSHEVLP